MAEPTAASTKKGPKLESWEEGEECSYNNNTLDLCGVGQNLQFDKYDGLMSGR